jgi:putative DNA primase/helicase
MPEPPPGDEDDGAVHILEVKKGRYADLAKRIERVAVAEKLPIFSHGELPLCRPVTEQRKRRRDRKIVTVAVLRSYNAASLRRALDPVIRFVRFNVKSQKTVPCEPPGDVINMVLAGDQAQVFRPIRGIIGTPTLRPDATIMSSPGYDEETGYFLIDPPAMAPVPDQPTKQDALAALGLYADLLDEFPFVDGISRSVAYSGLITPMVRAACDVVPAHLFTAPREGSGKSLLVDIACVIATGDRAYAILAHRQPEEQDKQLSAAIIDGLQFIVLDNLLRNLDSALFGQLSERENVLPRRLGGGNVAVRNGFNPYATGNNVSAVGDNIRRVLTSRLDPRVENPIERAFNADPIEWVLADRGKYVAAALTIVRAYLATGRAAKLTPLPSYGDWSRLVREPLVWLGCDDPVESMKQTLREDPGNAELLALITAWPLQSDGRTPVTLSVAQLVVAAAMRGKGGPLHPYLAETLQAVASDRQGKPNARSLGDYLRWNKGRITGGKKLVQDGFDGHSKVVLWTVANG